jgi:hypothetical protein
MFLAMLLPLSVFLVLCRAFLHRGDSSREAILRAAVVFVTILVTITELLSVPYLITRNSVITAWALVLVALLAYLAQTLHMPPANIDQAARHPVHLPPHLARIDIALATLIAAMLAVIGLIAILTPPNTADAMANHLPRVLDWVSNHTVRNVSTVGSAQLIQAPADAYIHLHIYLLSGGDRLFNLVELFSLLGSAIAASLITGKFGAYRTAQLLAALFVVTIPQAVLEPSGFMTTVVATFWIAIACYFTLRAVKDQTPIDVLTAALACGLALLTEGAAFIFLPFVIMGSIFFRPAPRRTWMLKRVPLMILIALGFNTGQFIRAYQVSGTPLGVSFATGAHHRHIITPDVHGSAWPGDPLFGDTICSETQAGNSLHLLLLILTLIALPYALSKLDPKHRSLLWYNCGIALAFCVSCAAVRWQPWGSRFHLPVFILAAATFGLLADRILRPRWLIGCLSALLAVNALLYLLSNSIRPILQTKPTFSLPWGELCFDAPDPHLFFQVPTAAHPVKPTGPTYQPLPAPQESSQPPSPKP